ncbi:MAG: insulinase family protein, partial [Candidatus Saccharibacteria bacterium]
MKHTVEEVRLKNGGKGLLIDIPGATVMSFQFHFRAGNRYVKSKEIYETAHIMEHMAFGANSEYKNEHDYEAEFTKNGAYHNAYTSEFAMGYVADCADFEWDRILHLQRLAICEPRFTNASLTAEKGNVRNELTGYLNNHNRVLWPKVQQLLGEDIYSYRQRLKTIANVKLADVKEHHARTHTADNLRFVIAGKLTGRKTEIKRQLEEWSLPRGEHFEIPKDELASANPALIRRKEASNLTFGWSLVVPRELSDDETDAMNCLDHILTGTMHSRIFGAARQKGLAYGMFSDTSVGFHDSSWDFGGQVNLETAAELFDIIVRELQTVLDGKITQEEVD